jgi:hypothetical protein
MAQLTPDQAASLSLARDRIIAWREEIESLKAGHTEFRHGDDAAHEAVARLEQQILEAERLLDAMDPEGLTIAGDGQ